MWWLIVGVVLGSLALLAVTLKVVHRVVGTKLLPFFLAYETKRHGNGLCSESGCSPVRSRGMYAYLEDRKEWPSDWHKPERMDSCISRRAITKADSWVTSLPPILRMQAASKHLDKVKQDAKRLAELEAERVEREARIDVIRKELQQDDEARIREAFKANGL